MRLLNVSKQGAVGSTELQVLSEEQLGRLHKVLLLILDDTLEICRENGLRFVLIGGSAIGALRHGGFIPWDDDIDLAMPRADFEKFTRIVRERYGDKYTILHPRDRENYGRTIPKIRLNGTEYRTVLEKDLDECGVFIDIFLIENVPDNNLLMFCQGFLSMAFSFALSCRRLFRGRKWYGQLMPGLSFRVKCALGFLFSFASYETWTRWTDYWNSRCRNPKTRRVSIPTDERHYFGEINTRQALCQTREVIFEGRTCYVPAQVESYLTGIYGDYMQIPPKEKQERNRYLAYDLGAYGDGE